MQATAFALAGVVLSGCTSGDTPPPAAPLPAERAAAAEDICDQLLPPRALGVLAATGGFSAFTLAPVSIPLTPPGGTGRTATEGCELRLKESPLEGVVVRRVLDPKAIGELRDGIERTTDELPDAPHGWDLRWSDAASTVFAFPTDDQVQEAYVAQLVLQRAGVDRRKTLVRLVDALLTGVASQR